MLFKHRGGNQPKLTSLVLESLEPEGLFTFHLFETELDEHACFFEFWDDFELESVDTSLCSLNFLEQALECSFHF